MAREQYEGEHEYLLRPSGTQNQDSRVSATYDKFLTLRDTLIFSGKFYNDKSGAKLVIGEKCDTVEVIFNNIFKQTFESGMALTSTDLVGKYVETVPAEEFTVRILKNGRYKIVHKEEILLNSDTTRVHCYIKYSHFQDEGYIESSILVYDWIGECEVEGTSITLGTLLQRMTSYNAMDKELFEGDKLQIICEDQDGNPLRFQTNSNYRSVEYTDLPLKRI